MMGMEDKELFSQLEEVMKVENLTCDEEVEAMQAALETEAKGKAEALRMKKKL